MTTRKQKPNFPSAIELPDERLQLATITVEQKTPAGGNQTRQATDFYVTQPLPRRKVTLH
jgi:hypothetical protein